MEVLNNLRLKQKKRVYSVLRAIETIFDYEPQSYYLDKHSNYETILEQAKALTYKNHLVSIVSKLKGREYIITVIRWSHLNGVTESYIIIDFNGKVSHSEESDLPAAIVDIARKEYGPLTVKYPPQIKMSVTKDNIQFIVPTKCVKASQAKKENENNNEAIHHSQSDDVFEDRSSQESMEDEEYSITDQATDTIVSMVQQVSLNDKGEYSEPKVVLVGNTNGKIKTLDNPKEHNCNGKCNH